MDDSSGGGDAEAVRRQLHRMLSSRQFDASKRNRLFLTYIVEASLDGRTDEIKAYTIATRVFGRDDDFDPQSDPIVRIEAGRLRRSLDRYYVSAGDDDAIEISIPSGSYVPAFSAIGPRKSGGQRMAASTPRKDPGQHGPSILVTPFEQDGDASTYASFSRGLARHIVVGLTRFMDLSIYSAEATDMKPRSFVAEHGIDFELTGGVIVSDRGFSLEVLLSDARSRRHVWGGGYDGALVPADIMRVRDEVADNIVRTLAQPYGVIFSHKAREAEGAPPQHLSSYNSVIQFYHYWRTYDPDLFETVRSGLEEAIKRDPGYAEAFACLSMTYSNGVRFGHGKGLNGAEARQRAFALATRAVELSPNSSQSYHALSLACWFTGDVDGSIAALETGRTLNPNDTDVMADLGLRYTLKGEWDKGVPLLESSYARNPSQPGTYRAALSIYHYMHGRFRDALAEARRTGSQVIPGHVLIAVAAVELGLQREVDNALKAIRTLDPDYGDHVVTDLKTRNLAPGLIERFVEGLRKAGLRGAEIGPDERRSAQ